MLAFIQNNCPDTMANQGLFQRPTQFWRLIKRDGPPFAFAVGPDFPGTLHRDVDQTPLGVVRLPYLEERGPIVVGAIERLAIGRTGFQDQERLGRYPPGQTMAAARPWGWTGRGRGSSRAGSWWFCLHHWGHTRPHG